MSRFRAFGLISTAIIVALIGLGQPAVSRAQDATPAADCPTTTVEENKEIVRRWFEALSIGSGADVGALAAEDIIYHDASPDVVLHGGAEDWANERQQDFPDFVVTVEQVIAEDDMVASYQRYAGTQSADVEEDLDIPVTDQAVEWIGMAVFRMECGKIAELWTVADDLGRLQALGVITDEEIESYEPVATPAP